LLQKAALLLLSVDSILYNVTLVKSYLRSKAEGPPGLGMPGGGKEKMSRDPGYRGGVLDAGQKKKPLEKEAWWFGYALYVL